jgi:hypothetical protein
MAEMGALSLQTAEYLRIYYWRTIRMTTMTTLLQDRAQSLESKLYRSQRVLRQWYGSQVLAIIARGGILAEGNILHRLPLPINPLFPQRILTNLGRRCMN